MTYEEYVAEFEELSLALLVVQPMFDKDLPKLELLGREEWKKYNSGE